MEVALKEHLEKQIASLRDEMHKSEKLLDIRLAGMNEVRDALKDQSARMATREYVDLQIEKLETILRGIESKIDDSMAELGKRVDSLEKGRVYIIGFAVGVATLASVVVRILF